MQEIMARRPMDGMARSSGAPNGITRVTLAEGIPICTPGGMPAMS
jgi:hypothetical protein